MSYFVSLGRFVNQTLIRPLITETVILGKDVFRTAVLDYRAPIVATVAAEPISSNLAMTSPGFVGNSGKGS